MINYFMKTNQYVKQEGNTECSTLQERQPIVLCLPSHTQKLGEEPNDTADGASIVHIHAREDNGIPSYEQSV